MINPENIPDFVIEWLEEKSFRSLNADQQAEVLKYLSEAEFDELHTAAALIKSNGEKEEEVSPQVKVNLYEAFDRRTKGMKHKGSIMLYPVQLWKVAAVFLLMAGGTFWLIIQAKTNRPFAYVTVKDTVYVPSFTSQDEKTVKVHDTVYIREDENQSKAIKKTIRHRIEAVINEPVETSTYLPSSLPGIHLLSIREKDAVPNKPKGNSLKDDSLLQHYRFVRL